jgi:putative glutathione S-transferase
MAVGLILVDGVWHEHTEDLEKTKGRFIRMDSVFRDWVKADGSTSFQPESGRYHLYVSHACPWAHRTMIFRKLKNLEEVIDYSVVHPFMGEKSWHFGKCEGCTPDNINGFENLYESYLLAEPKYTGYITVPVLWDKKTQKIVNNESSEIIRMLNTEFDAFTDVKTDYYPQALQSEIDEVNERIYHDINNGVYKSGFAVTQEAYNDAVTSLFTALDWVEERLSTRRYLCGDVLTEADWRLFTTLVRFDPVYVGHFKCNLKRIVDYPNLWGYTRELYQMPGIKETVDMMHIKNHYYQSHDGINPTGIVPKGPVIDFDEPHDRDQ